MENDTVLSIIIPIFNSKLEDVKRCLNSIKNICVSYEIIVIDDGSEEYVKAFFETYVGATYFYQENSGVSIARNHGIEKAKGKYITFVDADDCLTEEFCNFINDKIEKFDEDFYIFNVLEVREDNRIKKRTIYESERKCSKEEIIERILQSSDLNECWGKLFKRELVMKLDKKFPEKVLIGEDVQFIIRYLYLVNSIYVFDIYAYLYYIPSSQHSRVIKNPYQRILNVAERYEELAKIISKLKQDKKLDRCLCKWLIKIVAHDTMAFMRYEKWDSRLEKSIVNKLMMEKNINRYRFHVWEGCSFFVKYILIRYKMWGIMKIIASKAIIQGEAK